MTARRLRVVPAESTWSPGSLLVQVVAWAALVVVLAAVVGVVLLMGWMLFSLLNGLVLRGSGW
jgi:hypothetical protein